VTINFSNEHLEQYETMSSFKQFKDEFQPLFFKNVSLNSDGIFNHSPTASLWPSTISTSHIKRLESQACLLGDAIRIRYPIIKDYTTAGNHLVVLPGLEALEYLSILDFCDTHPAVYGSPIHVTRLLHFKRTFQMRVCLKAYANTQVEHMCEAFVAEGKLKFEYRDERERSAKLEEDVRNQYGLWEEGSVRDVRLLKWALELDSE